jgi:hypothetical protein
MRARGRAPVRSWISIAIVAAIASVADPLQGQRSFYIDHADGGRTLLRYLRTPKDFPRRNSDYKLHLRHSLKTQPVKRFDL